ECRRRRSAAPPRQRRRHRHRTPSRPAGGLSLRTSGPRSSARECPAARRHRVVRGRRRAVKVSTWNVNGIRAREAQVLEWVQKESPDVLCLQEIKASPEDVPASLCELPGYWCFWHGHKGYSGVALHLRKERFPERPAFFHPPFDVENRLVATEVGGVL